MTEGQVEGYGDSRSRNWVWLSFVDPTGVREYFEQFPSYLHVLRPLCTEDECVQCDHVCTPAGYVLCGWRWKSSYIKRFLIEHTPSDAVCCVLGNGTKQYDMLSCAMLFRKDITDIVETKQLSLPSVQKAIKVCKQKLFEVDRGVLEKSDIESMNILIANDGLLEKCLDQQSNVFAASVWSFRQAFVGDHQTVFDTLAEVWRNGFYYFQSP